MLKPINTTFAQFRAPIALLMCIGFAVTVIVPARSADASPSPRPDRPQSSVVHGSGGDTHTCAVLGSGDLYCWGGNLYGQLGIGTTTAVSVPTRIAFQARFRRVAASGSFTCAVTSQGTVLCWGNNLSSQLGPGQSITQTTPVTVAGIDVGITDITAGYGHACALTQSRGVKCWGDNGSGQVGAGTVAWSEPPRDVIGLTSGVHTIVAGRGHTCAVTDQRKLFCWGANHDGQLGNGVNGTSNVPVEVLGVSDVADVAAGWHHTCAIISGGGIKCWGRNDEQQLGNGSTIDSLTPVTVTGPITGATELIAGERYTCALNTAGAVVCWGYDGSNSYPVPGYVPGVESNAVSLFGSSMHRCAVMRRGALRCWGYNSLGQLGAGMTSPVSPGLTALGPLKFVNAAAIWQ